MPGGQEVPGQSTVQPTDGGGASEADTEGGHCLPEAVALPVGQPVDQPGQVKGEEPPGEEEAARVPAVAEGAKPGEMTSKLESLAAIIIPPERLPDGGGTSGGEAVQRMTSITETARVHPAGESLAISIPAEVGAMQEREDLIAEMPVRVEPPTVPEVPGEETPALGMAAADPVGVSIIITDIVDPGEGRDLAMPAVQTGATLIIGDRITVCEAVDEPGESNFAIATSAVPEAVGGLETPTNVLHVVPSGLIQGGNRSKVMPRHASLSTSPHQHEEMPHVPVTRGVGSQSGGPMKELCSGPSGQSPGGLDFAIPGTQPGLRSGPVEKGGAPHGELGNDLSWAEMSVEEQEHHCCDCCEAQPLFDNPFSIASRSVKKRFAKWKGKKGKSFTSSAEQGKAC